MTHSRSSVGSGSNAAGDSERLAPSVRPGADVTITCDDGYRLAARAFSPSAEADVGLTAVITAATGAKASYYWRYAAYLASRGFRAVVADYRGVGRSAPVDGPAGLRGMPTRWHEWGTLDTDAVIHWAMQDGPERKLVGVGHSFGGLGMCLAPRAPAIERVLMVGAQHAHWRDYATRRSRAFWQWHVVMPVLARATGYLPGRRFGRLENMPRGIAFDWARGRANFADTIGKGGAEIMARVAKLDFEVLSVASTDDPFATEAAMGRLLDYLPAATVQRHRLVPAELGEAEIGHLGLFHERFKSALWGCSAEWLTHGGTVTC